LLALLLGSAALAGCGGHDDPVVETRTISADGVKGIADSSFNTLFTGGDAARGVADLIAKGKVTINGSAVPAASGDRLDINDGRGLWKNADGTWSWDVHVLFKGENKPYAEAVVGFVNHATMLRGIDYAVTMTDGVASGIAVTVMDVAMADTVSKGATATTLTTVGKGDNSTNKPSPSTVAFPNAQVEGDPQGQDVVLYWKDTAGWHLKRAASRPAVAQVTVAVANGVETYGRKLDGVDMVDSRLTLQYSEPWNRPSQPYQAMAWMGENDVTLVQWQSVPGITIGLSRGANARPALAAAIAKGEAAHAAAKVSVAGDGSDVAAGQPWTTQAYRDIFTQAVADARAALADTAATNAQVEGALWRLAQAYGGRTGDRNSWLENRYFGKGSDYSRGAVFDTGYNGTGFWTFAQGHLGMASGAAVAP
jgi:hypothetical protein